MSEGVETAGRTERLIRENACRIADLEAAMLSARTPTDRAVDAISAFCGSVIFVHLHMVWFAGWIGANLWLPGRLRFDPFPFGLLTMIVSLEAILLSTFILITQNRSQQVADRRHHLDLQINLLAEREGTRILELLSRIAERVGIDETDPEIQELTEVTHPEEVVEEIERAVERTS